jgi:hypothetical protein
MFRLKYQSSECRLQRAELALVRADRLAAKLRELGVDPRAL